MSKLVLFKGDVNILFLHRNVFLPEIFVEFFLTRIIYNSLSMSTKAYPDIHLIRKQSRGNLKEGLFLVTVAVRVLGPGDVGGAAHLVGHLHLHGNTDGPGHLAGLLPGHLLAPPLHLLPTEWTD